MVRKNRSILNKTVVLTVPDRNFRIPNTEIYEYCNMGRRLEIIRSSKADCKGELRGESNSSILPFKVMCSKVDD